MKILVAIASYGTRNDRYLARVVQEYREMSFPVDIVILSNIPKEVAPGVKVVVGLPSKDPWSLPFGHQPIFREKMNDYDAFIYSEDDMLLSERNIRSFLKVQEALPEDEIAGFLRYEVGQNGGRNYPEMHANFHWDPRSVKRRGEFTLAFFTNEHSACYVAGRRQLERAIDSGGFVVRPHSERYDLLCTAATDIYTQCGMRKLICVSHIDDFLVHHLPNKYVGTRFGIGETAFRAQVQALLDIECGIRPAASLLPPSADSDSVPKHYFEEADAEISGVIPPDASSLLSIGCGWGATEAALAKSGLQVTVVPLDSVIGACAETTGLECAPPDFDAALKQLEGKRFDVLLISNLLHLVEEPARLLSSFLSLLSEHGAVIVKIPNTVPRVLELSGLQRAKRDQRLGTVTNAGATPNSQKALLSWFEAVGLRARLISRSRTKRSDRWARITFGLLDRWLSSEMIAVFVAGSSLRRHSGKVCCPAPGLISSRVPMAQAPPRD